MAGSNASSLQRSGELRRNSCDTLCSSNSSCFLQKRKPINPLARSVRTTVSVSHVNTIKQRVLSAKLLRMRSLQNQLNDANFHLTELAKENRALKTLQKRQDKALLKYEDANADLPRLLKSHEEEIRVLKERAKLTRRTNRELAEQLKAKDEELVALREQLRHLTELTKDRHLGEREKLSQQLEDFKDKLKSSEDQVNLLNRKLMLETKNLKHRLNQEISKNKNYQKELEVAYGEISKLNSLITGRKDSPGRKKHPAASQRHTISMVTLAESKSGDLVQRESEKIRALLEEDELEADDPPERDDDGGAAPPPKKPPEEDASDGEAVTLKSPTERVKQRLLKKTSAAAAAPERTSQALFNRKRNRPSSTKLERMEQAEAKGVEEELCRRMDDCCSDIMSSVQDYNEKIGKKKHEYEWSVNETERLLESLREADKLDSKLRLKKLLAEDVLATGGDGRDVAEEILREESLFQRSLRLQKEAKGGEEEAGATDGNGNVLKGDSKSKLLATLRAMDQGEAAAPGEGLGKSRLLEELLGDLNQ